MEIAIFYLQLGFIGAGIGLLTSLIFDKVVEVKQKKRDKELLAKVQKLINEYEAKVNELDEKYCISLNELQQRIDEWSNRPIKVYVNKGEIE